MYRLCNCAEITVDSSWISNCEHCLRFAWVSCWILDVCCVRKGQVHVYSYGVRCPKVGDSILVRGTCTLKGPFTSSDCDHAATSGSCLKWANGRSNGPFWHYCQWFWSKRIRSFSRMLIATELVVSGGQSTVELALSDILFEQHFFLFIPTPSQSLTHSETLAYLKIIAVPFVVQLISPVFLLVLQNDPFWLQCRKIDTDNV